MWNQVGIHLRYVQLSDDGQEQGEIFIRKFRPQRDRYRAGITPPKGEVWFLSRLFVKETDRRKRVAEKLLSAAFDYILAQGEEQAWFGLQMDNLLLPRGDTPEDIRAAWSSWIERKKTTTQDTFVSISKTDGV